MLLDTPTSMLTNAARRSIVAVTELIFGVFGVNHAEISAEQQRQLELGVGLGEKQIRRNVSEGTYFDAISQAARSTA
jgi:hypothetical protein